MRSLVATHLNDHQLDQYAAVPATEIARDIVGLFPEFLDDPRVNARFYVVSVARDDLYFVVVMAPPAPTPAPSILALRSAARRPASASCGQRTSTPGTDALTRQRLEARGRRPWISFHSRVGVTKVAESQLPTCVLPPEDGDSNAGRQLDPTFEVDH